MIVQNGRRREKIGKLERSSCGDPECLLESEREHNTNVDKRERNITFLDCYVQWIKVHTQNKISQRKGAYKNTRFFLGKQIVQVRKE